MRVLMVVPKYPLPVVGGLERQAHELTKALIKRGHAVIVLSSQFDRSHTDFETIDGVRVHRIIWIENRLARFMILPYHLACFLYKNRSEIDLVHVHNVSWFGAFVTMLSKLFGLGVITKLPNIGIHGIPGMRRGAVGFLRIVLLKQSDAIVAMTSASVNELNEIGYPYSRTLKVTNGVSALPKVHRSPRQSSTEVTVVFVGRLFVQKGLTDLIQAWKKVILRATRATKLRLIGTGPQESELRALVEVNDLNESVEFVGYCDDVPSELEKADLFVLPSHAEGNSNAILEAMRAGLPIVATRIGGAAVQVGSEADHFLVPVGDQNGLADRLLELIEDDALRLRMGANMRFRIETQFSIDKTAAVYEQAYELILTGYREQIGQINSSIFSKAETPNKKCAE